MSLGSVLEVDLNMHFSLVFITRSLLISTLKLCSIMSDEKVGLFHGKNRENDFDIDKFCIQNDAVNSCTNYLIII